MSEYNQMYLEELKGLVPCSEEEEKELVARLQANDQEARSRLVEGLLGFAWEMAKEYEREGILLEDLVQEANMALMQFVSEYEQGEFHKELEEELRRVLKNYVQQEIDESEIEEEIAARVNVLQEVSRVLAEDLGREATLEELADKMKMEEEEVREIMRITMNALKADGWNGR